MEYRIVVGNSPDNLQHNVNEALAALWKPICVPMQLGIQVDLSCSGYGTRQVGGQHRLEYEGGSYRNALRKAGYDEEYFDIANLDDIYIQLVEIACKELRDGS